MEQKNIVKNKKLLFSPHMHHMLKKKGYSKDNLQIIEEGCELEDIFSLLPNELDEAIEDIKKESLS